ncbi:MAG TPA: hypothetical protein VFA20_14075 [Myxococcaceae bacterium]|nr:hypothetical protein [Myxococcaceae bacterium]
MTLLLAGAAPASRSPQLKRKWKGAYADEAAITAWLMKEKKVAGEEAKKLAPQILAKLKQQAEVVKQVYPGLKDEHFDYDLFQDAVVGPDRELPNCFGDVCKGAKERWEPDKAALDAWLAGEKYFKTSNTGCECGQEKVAVYEMTLEYSDGASAGKLVQPFHIAQQQEDCSWRSRLGGLGVIIHAQAEQLLSQFAGEGLAKKVAQSAGVSYKKGTAQMTSYTRTHVRAGFHGTAGGPLTCDPSRTTKKKENK